MRPRATMAAMRRLLPLLLIALLAACARQAARDGAPTPPPAPTLPLVAEILAGPTPGPVRTIGYLFAGPEGAALVGAMRLGGAGAPAPLDDDGIWLGAAPLPAGEAAAGYTIVEASGRLEGPGRFGPGGRYSFSLAEPALKPRAARDLSIALLLENSGLYEGQPVRVRGQLLTSPDTALLVESLGAGGVPDARARQVKLAAAPADPAVAASLQRSGSGRVSYGPVEIVGIWRAGRLYPLAARPG